MQTLDVEYSVIGAGVVGLAIARQLSREGREVAILESESGIGMMTSSRNSEVIHAGIYYPQGSLKANLCLRGKKLIYDYCQEKGIDFQRIGKLIVATTPQEVQKLKSVKVSADANGVTDLEWRTHKELQHRYPELNGIAALWSPSTGILDSHQFMSKLLEDAEHGGAMLALGNHVRNVRLAINGFKLNVQVKNGETYELRTKYLVNSAGLKAWDIASGINATVEASIPPKHFAKGSYFKLVGPSPFDTLVYPIPPHGGLGIHLTLDMMANARFGPDVEWGTGEDYAVSETREAVFRRSIELYYPGIKDRELQPDYAGIRPKISGPSDPQADFLIQTEIDHGVRGLINLYGIESPGLTASMAIAEFVGNRI